MYKIVFACCLVLAMANAQSQELDTTYTRPEHDDDFHGDDYVDMYRQYYNEVIEDLDAKLDHAHNVFVDSVNGLNLISSFLTDTVTKTTNDLRPFKMLSATSKNCIVEYEGMIPNTESIQRSISDCTSTATNVDLHAQALKTRNDLADYYRDSFEPAIADCHNSYECVTNVTREANAYTIKKQKEFGYQMEVADCSTKEKLKRALDCSFNEQLLVSNAITKAKRSIDKCRATDCQPCTYKCDAILQLNPHEVYNQEVANPFYNITSDRSCFMLAVGKTVQYAIESDKFQEY